MRIALVSVPVWTIGTPPLNISYLKAYLKESGCQTKCFDVNTELYHRLKPEQRIYWQTQHYNDWQWEDEYKKAVFPKIVEPNIDFFVDKLLAFKPKIVGISVYSPCFTKTLAKKLKEKNPELLIVLGGQVCIDQMQGLQLKKSRDIDIIVRGEGEHTLKRIADVFGKKGKVEDCKGCLVRKGKSFVDCGEDERIKDPDSIPYPDFDDYNLELYYDDYELTRAAKALPIILSRGCNNPCDFCLQRKVWKDKLFARKAKSVFYELVRNKEKYGITKFVFADLLLNGNLLELERLCDLIIENNFPCSWWGSAKIDKRMDLNFFKKLRKAGCHQLDLGIESASDHVLKAMGKTYTSEDIREFLKNMKKADIAIGSNFILGHPSESREEFMKTLKFIKEMRKFTTKKPWPTYCAIFRGTGLYNKLKNNKDFKYDAVSWAYKDNTFEEREKRAEMFRLLCLEHYKEFEMFDVKKSKFPMIKWKEFI